MEGDGGKEVGRQYTVDRGSGLGFRGGERRRRWPRRGEVCGAIDIGCRAAAPGSSARVPARPGPAFAFLPADEDAGGAACGTEGGDGTAMAFPGWA